MYIWLTLICLSWPPAHISTTSPSLTRMGVFKGRGQCLLIFVFLEHLYLTELACVNEHMPFLLNYIKTKSHNSLSILMTRNQTLLSSLPLFSWNAITGWLKRTASSRMSSKNVVGWQICCKLSGLETKILSLALEILLIILKCDSKMWFHKNESIYMSNSE